MLNMIRQIVFLFVTSLMIIYGVVSTLRYFGWPSASDRKNKMMRAIKTGTSSTVLMIGLMLVYFYWASPETFWNQWTFATFLAAVLFFVIPVFGLMTVTSYVQFSVLEKTQSIMTNRLRKIVGDSSKEEKRIK